MGWDVSDYSGIDPTGLYRTPKKMELVASKTLEVNLNQLKISIDCFVADISATLKEEI